MKTQRYVIILVRRFLHSCRYQLKVDSRFLNRTFKTWLSGLTDTERSELFDLLMLENASCSKDVIRPQNILALFKNMHMDEERSRMIASVLLELVESTKSTHNQMTQ